MNKWIKNIFINTCHLKILPKLYRLCTHGFWNSKGAKGAHTHPPSFCKAPNVICMSVYPCRIFYVYETKCTCISAFFPFTNLKNHFIVFEEFSHSCCFCNCPVSHVQMCHRFFKPTQFMNISILSNLLKTMEQLFSKESNGALFTKIISRYAGNFIR